MCVCACECVAGDDEVSLKMHYPSHINREADKRAEEGCAEEFSTGAGLFV